MRFELKVSVLLLWVNLLFVSGYDVRASGRITCYDRGIPFTKITLMDDDPIDKNMGHATTTADGHFYVTGSASDIAFRKSKRRPDVLIRMEYEHESSYSIFKVTLPFYKSREKSRTLDDRSGDVDFGTINFRSEACLTYLRFYDATLDFYHRVGYRVPFELTVRTEYIVHGGTPYAYYKTIHLPKSSNVALSTAKHELAHTVRHHFDGSFTHFIGDVAKFKYTQRHTCSSTTNNGFAFNEGWAEYWAGSCQFGNATGLFSVEQNVATALTSLQTRCGTSHTNMWNVLKSNPGAIHSFPEFQSHHNTLYSCL